jgi:phosphonatase-like hydrolase
LRKGVKLDIELVVCDMVGTTVQDDGQVLDAFSAALVGNGIHVTPSELQQWRGASKRQVLRFFIERQFGTHDKENLARTQRTYADFRERLEENYTNDGARAIDGAEITFRWIAERGGKIVLTTGFDRTVANIILGKVGWRHALVDDTICSDEVSRGRPAPYMIFRAMEATGVTDVRRVAKVGDTAFDLMAGTNAGARAVVGVLTGSQGLEYLGCVPHTHIIPSVEELPTLFQTESERGKNYPTENKR